MNAKLICINVPDFQRVSIILVHMNVDVMKDRDLKNDEVVLVRCRTKSPDEGYTGDGLSECYDLNECEAKTHQCAPERTTVFGFFHLV